MQVVVNSQEPLRKRFLCEIKVRWCSTVALCPCDAALKQTPPEAKEGIQRDARAEKQPVQTLF